MTNHVYNFIQLSRAAFHHNIAQYRALLPAHMHLAVVVKSNAYGHGIDQIIQLCKENNDIHMLCTAMIEEALYLREQGIKKPILVLYPAFHLLKDAIAYNIKLTVDDNDQLNTLNNIARQLNKQAQIHLKINTGLNRYGSFKKQAIHILETIKKSEYLSLDGLYTHFAESDLVGSDYTHKQWHEFKQILTEISRSSLIIPYIHAANSAAASTLDLSGTNLVRMGAGAYGLWPSYEVKELTQRHCKSFVLRQVISWHTHIHDIKTVPAGSYIGYGRMHCTMQETTLAILPIGYHEGYHRRLSNVGIVKIGDQYAPVLGRIAMNATVINVTHIPHIHRNMPVIMLADDDKLNALALSHTLGSYNPREVTTRCNPHVKRLIL